LLLLRLVSCEATRRYSPRDLRRDAMGGSTWG